MAAASWVAAVAAVATLVAVQLGAFQLFGGDDVGLADNGDGQRLTCEVGLGLPSEAARTRGIDFEIDRPARGERCVVPERERYRSSQTYLVRLADALAPEGRAFDLRVLGWLCVSLLALAAGGAMAVAVQSPKPLRVAILGVVVVAYDITWLTYFNSTYAEPIALIGLTALAPLALAWTAPRGSLAARAAVLGMLTMVSALVLTAKSQYTALLPGMALVILAGRLPAKRRLLAVGGPIVAVVALGAVDVAYLASQGRAYEFINKHHLVFTAVLPFSHDRVGALEELGFPAEFVEGATQDYWTATAQPSGVAHHPAYERELLAFSRADALRYWLRHPVEATRIFRYTAAATTHARVPYLGNYDEASPRGRLATLTNRPDPAMRLLAVFRSIADWFFPLLWLSAGAAACLLAWRPRESWERPLGALGAFLASGAFFSTAATILGDGTYEVARHQVPAAWTTAALILVGPGCIVAVVLRAASTLRNRTQPRDSVAPQPSR